MGRSIKRHSRITTLARTGRSGVQGGFGRDSLVTGAGSIATIALSGLSAVIIARELGPYGRGNWAAIFSLATLVSTLAALGLPTAGAYGVARLKGEGQRALLAATARTALLLSLLSFAGYLIITLVARPGQGAGAAIAGGALIAGLAVILSVAQQLVLVAARLRWFIAAQLIPAALALVGVLALAAIGRLTLTSVVALYAARTFSGAVIATSGLVEAGSMSRASIFGRAARLSLLAPYLGYAFMTFATLSLTQVVQRVDVLLVAGIRGSRAAGLYAVAVQVLELLIVIPGALGFVLFRRGARSSRGHWKNAVTALRWVIGIQTMAAAVVFVGAPEIIGVIYGDRYLGAVVSLRWLMPGAVMLGAQTVASNYIAGRGRPRSVLVAWAAGATIGIGLNLVLIPVDGIAGAAAVSSLAFTVVFAIHLLALRSVRRTDESEVDVRESEVAVAPSDGDAALDDDSAC